MPALYASIIAGFPRITASNPPWLIEMVCQVSYPRNSENARPLGTLRLYLSWPELANPLASTVVNASEMPAPIKMLLVFMVAPHGSGRDVSEDLRPLLKI